VRVTMPNRTGRNFDNFCSATSLHGWKFICSKQVRHEAKQSEVYSLSSVTEFSKPESLFFDLFLKTCFRFNDIVICNMKRLSFPFLYTLDIHIEHMKNVDIDLI
jgi:hypothetical protein